MTNPAWWGIALTGIGGGLTWCTYIARMMWGFRGKWDDTNYQLRHLSDQIAALAARDNAIEQRLERHLDWHDSHANWKPRGA